MNPIYYGIAACVGGFIGPFLVPNYKIKLLSERIAHLTIDVCQLKAREEAMQEEINRLTFDAVVRQEQRDREKAQLDTEWKEAQEKVMKKYNVALKGLKDR